MGNIFSTAKVNKLERLKQFCTKYTADAQYVYKTCSDCLIVMTKRSGSIINEDRDDIIDKLNAKYTTNVIDVIAVIDINTLKPCENIMYYIYKDFKVCFKAGGRAYADQNEFEKDNIAGISYYKTIDRAFYDRIIPEHHNGEWIEWYNNGQKKSVCNYYTLLDYY